MLHTCVKVSPYIRDIKCLVKCPIHIKISVITHLICYNGNMVPTIGIESTIPMNRIKALKSHHVCEILIVINAETPYPIVPAGRTFTI